MGLLPLMLSFSLPLADDGGGDDDADASTFVSIPVAAEAAEAAEASFFTVIAVPRHRIPIFALSPAATLPVRCDNDDDGDGPAADDDDAAAQHTTDCACIARGLSLRPIYMCDTTRSTSSSRS